jgi:hypothetical protein
MFKFRLSLKSKGSIIITVLFLSVILLMYASVLIKLNQQNLRSVRANRDRIAAQQMAQAGINDIIHTLFLNTNFGKNQEVLEYTSSENPDLGYRVSFNPTDPFHSVNNLDNPADSHIKNFEGKKVARETIDIVSVGIAGKGSIKTTEHKIQILIRRDLSYGLSIGAMDHINATGKVEIDGIMSMLEMHSKIPGSMHSNSDLCRSSSEGPSIQWLPAPGGSINDFILGGGSVFSTVGEVSNNLLSLNPRESEPKKIYPNIQVTSIVRKKASSTAPLSGLKVRIMEPGTYTQKIVDIPMTYHSGSNSHIVGYVSIGSDGQGYERYHKGNLIVNGNITLNNGSLYIDGNLTVNGGITGHGSVYVAGDISILGGNSTIVTNQIDSCSIFSDGEVNLAGLDARGYLEALAKQYPDTIGKAYFGDSNPNTVHDTGFKKVFEGFTGFLTSKDKTGAWDFELYKEHFEWPKFKANATAFDMIHPNEWEKKMKEGTIDPDRVAAYLIKFASIQMTNFVSTDIWPQTPNDWISPSIPDGSHGFGKSDNRVTKMVKSFEDTLGMNNINMIPEARKVHQALVELFVYFRPTRIATKSHVPKEMPWLDELYGEKDWYNMVMGDDKYTQVFFYDDRKPWKQQSIQHLFFHTVNNYGLNDQQGYYNFPTDNIKLTYNEYFDMVKDFVFNNNPLDVNWLGESYLQGVFYAKGDIKISNNLTVYGAVITYGSAEVSDSKLIYCEEYLRMNPSVIPLTIVSYREL